MVQVPALSKVTVVPFVPPVVQTVVVLDVKVTGNAELAVAATVTGVWSMVLAARAPNVIVCGASETTMLCETGAAAA